MVFQLVLKKTFTTQTNESRSNIFNKHYASFRGTIFTVEHIFNKFDVTKTIDRIKNSVFIDNVIEYIKGSTVTSDTYNSNIEEIYASGIHYYCSMIPAFYAELSKVYLQNYTELSPSNYTKRFNANGSEF